MGGPTRPSIDAAHFDWGNTWYNIRCLIPLQSLAKSHLLVSWDDRLLALLTIRGRHIRNCRSRWRTKIRGIICCSKSSQKWRTRRWLSANSGLFPSVDDIDYQSVHIREFSDRPSSKRWIMVLGTHEWYRWQHPICKSPANWRSLVEVVWSPSQPC